MRDNRINGALNVSRTIGDLDFKRNAELPHTEQMVRAALRSGALWPTPRAWPACCTGLRRPHPPQGLPIEPTLQPCRPLCCSSRSCCL